MVREDKVQIVKDLEELFKSANALVLAEYRGLTVTQQTKLRRELKNSGASFNVVKMSLAKNLPYISSNGTRILKIIQKDALIKSRSSRALCETD